MFFFVVFPLSLAFSGPAKNFLKKPVKLVGQKQSWSGGAFLCPRPTPVRPLVRPPPGHCCGTPSKSIFALLQMSIESYTCSVLTPSRGRSSSSQTTCKYLSLSPSLASWSDYAMSLCADDAFTQTRTILTLLRGGGWRAPHKSWVPQTQGRGGEGRGGEAHLLGSAGERGGEEGGGGATPRNRPDRPPTRPTTTVQKKRIKSNKSF